MDNCWPSPLTTFLKNIRKTKMLTETKNKHKTKKNPKQRIKIANIIV